MDPFQSPSIMGSENAKFVDRHDDRSQADTGDFEAGLDGMQPDSNGMYPRKSKEGLSREERTRIVRERQLVEQRRRLDELRQAQLQALKAKQQLEEERRRRTDELRSREEQRRAAVEARRKQLQNLEQSRKEAIMRKHEEIFCRIENKRRQHESRKQQAMLMTSSAHDGFSVNSAASRRAVSVGVLNIRSGSGTLKAPASSRLFSQARQHHSNALISPGIAHSARTGVTPNSLSSSWASTPSKPGHNGNLLESRSGNLDDWSPGHSSRIAQGKHFRWTPSSQPPSSSRRRTPTDVQPSTENSSRTVRPSRRSPQRVNINGSQTERARRPTSLATRSSQSALSSRQSDGEKTSPRNLTVWTGSKTFKDASKRSQSVSNVSGKSAHRDTSLSVGGDRANSANKAGDQGNETNSPTGTASVQSKRIIISEAEAKAILAEKRRLARQQQQDQLTIKPSMPVESSAMENEERFAPSSLGVDPVNISTDDSFDMTRKSARSQSIVTFEEDEAEMERAAESSDRISDVVIVTEKAKVQHVPDDKPATVVRQIDAGDLQSEAIDDEIPSRQMVSSILSEPESYTVPVVSAKTDEEPATASNQVCTDVTKTIVAENVESQLMSEMEQRRTEAERREEEERAMRRQRLEAIKRLTKGDSATLPSPVQPQMPANSPMTESRSSAFTVPSDALENARKLLQRRGLGITGESPNGSLTGSLTNLAVTGADQTINGETERKQQDMNVDDLLTVSSSLSPLNEDSLQTWQQKERQPHPTSRPMPPNELLLTFTD